MIVDTISEAKHCPVISDVRALITKPPPACQSETILRLFDDAYKSEVPKCICCYSCIKQHSADGCHNCELFLNKFFSQNPLKKFSKSVAFELKEALEELFVTLQMDTLLVEGDLVITTKGFIKDFIKMCDEIKTKEDIIEMWHIDEAIALNVILLFHEVINEDLGDILSCDDSDDESETDLEEDDICSDSD